MPPLGFEPRRPSGAADRKSAVSTGSTTGAGDRRERNGLTLRPRLLVGVAGRGLWLTGSPARTLKVWTSPSPFLVPVRLSDRSEGCVSAMPQPPTKVRRSNRPPRSRQPPVSRCQRCPGKGTQRGYVGSGELVQGYARRCGAAFQPSSWGIGVCLPGHANLPLSCSHLPD
jgi:hypothetical protein